VKQILTQHPNPRRPYHSHLNQADGHPFVRPFTSCLKRLSSAGIIALALLGGFADDTFAQEGGGGTQITTNPPADQLKPEGTFERQKLTGTFYAEGATHADIDQDGKQDIVSGPYWYAGPKFEEKFELYPVVAFPPAGYSENFLTYAYDFNSDGWMDVLRFGFPGKETAWYENPGKDTVHNKTSHWKQHIAFDVTDNESPTLANVVGDATPELVFQTDGYFGYATMDKSNPTAKWTFHKVSEQIAGGRFTHGIGAGDVNGDQRIDILTSGGWFEQPADLADDASWKLHRVAFCPEGSQMYAYDFDGDGKNDVLTAIHAHQWGVVWHRQIENEKGEVDFQVNWIVGTKPEQTDHQVVFTQAHAIDLVDIDGDGLKDIVTGRRHWAHGGNDPGGNDPAVLYWFQTQRDGGKVRFVPHLVDIDSGVGTQVTTGDLNDDQKPDIIVGNKKGTFVFIQK